MYECYWDNEFLNVIEEYFHVCLEISEKMVSDAETWLYDGCTNFTKLSMVFKLYSIKYVHGWSDKSFTNLISLLKDMLS